MAWRVRIEAEVTAAINGLASSGALSRSGMLRAYNAVRLELPQQARRFRANRYRADPDCFIYPVGFRDRRSWHRFYFYVNDAIGPGLLVVEDMEHHVTP